MEPYPTRVLTFSLVDIKKTFEGFDADLRMIARRTGKWTPATVDNIIHDILIWAAEKHIDTIDVVLLDSTPKVIRAAKYTVNESGTTITGDKAGGNDWPEIPSTQLDVVVSFRQSWKGLSPEQQSSFKTTNGFKVLWTKSTIDTSYSHLTKTASKLYASNGFELQKTDYK